MEILPAPATMAAPIALQWGHSFSAVEIFPLVNIFPKFSVLQWGHSFSAVEIGKSGVNIIADVKLQWGHSFSAVEMKKHGILHKGKPLASMGPQLFSRGDVYLPSGDAGGHIRFNGATAFQPWRSFTRYLIALFSKTLQWGHSFSAVEIRTNRPMSRYGATASMGPQLFSRGDVLPDVTIWKVVSSLQWGHSFSAVEIFQVLVPYKT